MKPGIKTTEFWLAVVLAVLINAHAIFGDNQWTKLAVVVADALLAMGYGAMRTSAKNNAVSKTVNINASVPELEALTGDTSDNLDEPLL